MDIWKAPSPQTATTCLSFSQIFAPTAKEIAQAERVVASVRANADKGVGIFLLDGKMMDIAFVEGAERTIALAKASGVYKGEL